MNKAAAYFGLIAVVISVTTEAPGLYPGTNDTSSP
jgi:hypothetical protein